MNRPNPYAPPKAPSPTLPVAQGSCPACGSNDVRRPGFTWWGGAVGPKLLSHAVCNACGFGFNAKTGRSNVTAIAVYFGVVNVLVIALLWLWFVNRQR